MTRRRIGIFGGSFNPIHQGHLIVAQDALEQFELDGVLFVPCGVPVHKNPDALAPFKHRYAMVEAAIESDLCFSVSDVEGVRSGGSYAVDTVAALQEQHPEDEYAFIIGADTLFELHTWYRIYELLERCEVLTVCRPGVEIDEAARARIQLCAPWPERLCSRLGSAHLIDISSTNIRMRIAEGMRISYLVPAAIEMYVAEHHLYCS